MKLINWFLYFIGLVIIYYICHTPFYLHYGKDGGMIAMMLLSSIWSGIGYYFIINKFLFFFIYGFIINLVIFLIWPFTYNIFYELFPNSNFVSSLTLDYICVALLNIIIFVLFYNKFRLNQLG